MSYDKKKLAELLLRLLRATTEKVEDVDQSKSHLVLGGSGSHIELQSSDGRVIRGQMAEDGRPTLYVLEDGFLAQEALVTECLKDEEFAAKIGPDETRKRLQWLIRECFCREIGDSDIDDIVKQDFLKPLRAAVQHWVVKVPIANLQLSSSFEVGGVRFTPHEEGVVANARMVVERRGPDDVRRDLGEKAALLDMVGKIGQQAKAWATVEIDSTESLIVDVARDRVDTAINCVRAFTSVFVKRSINAAFGMPYELSSGMTGFVAQAGGNFAIKMDRRGFFVDFEINDEILAHLRERCEFERLSKIVGTPWRDLGTFARAIKVAALWLGRSVVATPYSQALAHCVISLERLLIVDNEETTVERFADRLAYLLADVPESRKQIHKFAKHLYDIRSRVVHAGFDGVKLSQVVEIEDFAVGSLIRSLQLSSTITEHTQLRDYLHDQKMS